MISTVLSQVTGQLDRRFLLNAFFPFLLFALLCALVVASGTIGVGNAIDRWTAAKSFTQVLITIGAVAFVLVGASLLLNGAVAITRIFEGYALPTKLLASWGRARQHALARELLEKHPDVYQKRFPVWPRKLRRIDVAPTTLGNVLRSAESYGRDRYGVDAIRAWPRLYPLLPEGLRTSMDAARSSMEFLLTVAFLASVYVLLAGAVLIITAGPLFWFVASVAGGSLTASVAYRGALVPAAAFGDQIRAAYDLHRLELLAQLRVPMPESADSERRTWNVVLPYLEAGLRTVWHYGPKP